MSEEQLIKEIVSAFEKVFSREPFGSPSGAIAAVAAHAIAQDNVIIKQKKQIDALRSQLNTVTAERESLVDRIHGYKEQIANSGHNEHWLACNQPSPFDRKESERLSRKNDELRKSVTHYYKALLPNSGNENVYEYPRRMFEYARSLIHKTKDKQVRIDELESDKHTEFDEELVEVKENYDDLREQVLCAYNEIAVMARKPKYPLSVITHDTDCSVVRALVDWFGELKNQASEVKLVDLALRCRNAMQKVSDYDYFYGFESREARVIPERLADKLITTIKELKKERELKKVFMNCLDESEFCNQELKDRIVSCYNAVCEANENASYIGEAKYLDMLNDIGGHCLTSMDTVRKVSNHRDRLINTLTTTNTELKREQKNSDYLYNQIERHQTEIKEYKAEKAEHSFTEQEHKELLITKVELQNALREANNRNTTKETEEFKTKYEEVVDEYASHMQTYVALKHENDRLIKDLRDLEEVCIKAGKEIIPSELELPLLSVPNWLASKITSTNEKISNFENETRKHSETQAELHHAYETIEEQKEDRARLKLAFDRVVERGYSMMGLHSSLSQAIAEVYREHIGGIHMYPTSRLIAINEHIKALTVALDEYEASDTANLAEQYSQTKELCEQRGEQIRVAKEKIEELEAKKEWYKKYTRLDGNPNEPRQIKTILRERNTAKGLVTEAREKLEELAEKENTIRVQQNSISALEETNKSFMVGIKGIRARIAFFVGLAYSYSDDLDEFMNAIKALDMDVNLIVDKVYEEEYGDEE
jgi:hypothetical protein